MATAAFRSPAAANNTLDVILHDQMPCDDAEKPEITALISSHEKQPAALRHALS
jgi:hypothetical protein